MIVKRNSFILMTEYTNYDGQISKKTVKPHTIFLPVHWQTVNLENNDNSLLPILWVTHQYSAEGQSAAIKIVLARRLPESKSNHVP
jgi:hypothetical protein